MKMNVGGIDKIARITLGAVFVGLTVADVIGVWGWVGIVPLVTGLINWCPMYSLIGADTRNSSTDKAKE